MYENCVHHFTRESMNMGYNIPWTIPDEFPVQLKPGGTQPAWFEMRFCCVASSRAIQNQAVKSSCSLSRLPHFA